MENDKNRKYDQDDRNLQNQQSRNTTAEANRKDNAAKRDSNSPVSSAPRTVENGRDVNSTDSNSANRSVNDTTRNRIPEQDDDFHTENAVDKTADQKKR